MLLSVVCACLVHASLAQRNVGPADTFHPTSRYEEFLFYEDIDDPPDVYKWNVEDFPHPINQSRFCGRIKPSYICDPDGVLTREQADYLDASIRHMQSETPCPCAECRDGEGGIVTGIALMKHIYQPYNLHHVETIRSFTESLRQNWRLGRCDNDLLVVVVTVDRMYYIDVGRTTSRYLSIKEANEIFIRRRSWFSAKNFFEGLRDIIVDYHQHILEKKIDPESEIDIIMVTGCVIGGVAALGLVIFIAFAVHRKCRKDNKGQTDTDKGKGPNEGVSSGWCKEDIKVLFGSEHARYQPCQQTDDHQGVAKEEVLDFTLATREDTSFAISELDKELTSAAKDIVKTFPTTKSQSSVLMTDM